MRTWLSHPIAAQSELEFNLLQSDTNLHIEIQISAIWQLQGTVPLADVAIVRMASEIEILMNGRTVLPFSVIALLL